MTRPGTWGMPGKVGREGGGGGQRVGEIPVVCHRLVGLVGG